MQLLHGNYYHKKSTQNFTRCIQVNGLRGTIYDKNDIILASTKPVIQLIWKKTPYTINSEDRLLIDFIEQRLNLPLDIHTLTSKNNNDTAVLTKSLSFTQLSILLEQYPNHPRLILQTEVKRSYPLTTCACHFIGHLESNQEHGLSGLEKLCDETLVGTSGLRESIVNARGTTISSKEIEQCNAGTNIKTTLDISMQKILEEILPSNSRNCALIIDTETGAIRAAASSPRFDPSLFLNKIDSKTWDDLSENQSLLNRFTQGTYPPGSPFKLITATAMLEEGLADHTTQWFCSGHVEYRGKKYHCHNRNGHGIVNLTQAIAHSCNVPFFCSAIAGLSIDTIASYAHIFGLGEKAGISLPENSGLVPCKQWKKKVKKEPWYTGETLSVTIGQGATLVTPLQIALMAAGIMTGFLVKPRILESEPIIKKNLPISTATRNFLKNSMLLATREGSTKRLKNIPHWEIHGKTGTAQVINFQSNEKTTPTIEHAIVESKRHHGWVVCLARYKKQPPFSLVILVENIGSSSIAVKYAREFFINYGKQLSQNIS